MSERRTSERTNDDGNDDDDKRGKKNREEEEEEEEEEERKKPHNIGSKGIHGSSYFSFSFPFSSSHIPLTTYHFFPVLPRSLPEIVFSFLLYPSFRRLPR